MRISANPYTLYMNDTARTRTVSPKTDATAAASLFSSPAVVNNIGSGTMNAFSAVDRFLNVGDSNRLESFFKLNDEDRKVFLSTLAKLAQAGVVGYEVVEDKNGERRREFIEVAMLDDRDRERKVVEDEESEDALAC